MEGSVATAPANEPGESVEHTSPTRTSSAWEECERSYWGCSSPKKQVGRGEAAELVHRDYKISRALQI